MIQSSHPVEDVLDTTDQLLEDGKDGLQVSELMDELGVKSIAAVLLAPSLALVSPLSGIPLFSSACGITIALISAQMLMGRNHLWLPSFLSKRGQGTSIPATNPIPARIFGAFGLPLKTMSLPESASAIVVNSR